MNSPLKVLSLCLLVAGIVGTDLGMEALSHVYQDDRLRVALPNGWTAKRAISDRNGNSQIGSPSVIGGVLSKGRFRLYLLTHYGQTSGVVGGRFDEIAPYMAPWMKFEFPGGCIEVFTKTAAPVTERLSRVDLFLEPGLTKKSQDPDCAGLRDLGRKPVWCGSYFGSPLPTSPFPGYFLSFPPGKDILNSDQEMAFTATSDATGPESLPAKTDRDLQEFLREASTVVKSIGYKRVPAPDAVE